MTDDQAKVCDLLEWFSDQAKAARDRGDDDEMLEWWESVAVVGVAHGKAMLAGIPLEIVDAVLLAPCVCMWRDIVTSPRLAHPVQGHVARQILERIARDLPAVLVDADEVNIMQRAGDRPPARA